VARLVAHAGATGCGHQFPEVGAMIWVAVVAVIAVGLFFLWANDSTAKDHAGFRPEDVESALANLVEAKPNEYLDDWELFLAWRIDDPQLERIRQECLEILKECPDDKKSGVWPSKAGLERVAELLRGLRERKAVSTDLSD
jgi:hypothetical protein